MRKLAWALLAAIWMTSAAYGENIVWNFDDIPIESGSIHFLPEPGYQSEGFSITGFNKLDPGIQHTFAYRGTDSAAYTGQALVTSTSWADTITKDDGGVFDLVSLDLRGGINSSDGYEDIHLIFTLEYADGTTAVTYADKNVAWTSLETFTNAMWTQLVSFTIDNDGSYTGPTSMGMEICKVVFNTVDQKVGDFDQDGDVDGYDLSVLASDMNQADMQEFAANYGRSGI